MANDENKNYIRTEGTPNTDYTFEHSDNQEHIVHQDVNPTDEVVYEITSDESELTQVNVENQHITKNEDQLVLSNSKEATEQYDNAGKIKINDLSQKYDGSAEAWKKEIQEGFLYSASSIASMPASIVKSAVEGVAMAAGEELSDRITSAIFGEEKKKRIRFTVFWGANIDGEFKEVEFTKILDVSIRKIDESNGEKTVTVQLRRGLDGDRIGFTSMTTLLDNNSVYNKDTTTAFSSSLALGTMPSIKINTRVAEGEIMLVVKGFPEGGLLPPIPGPLGKAELVYTFNRIKFKDYWIGMQENPVGKEGMRGDIAVEVITFEANLSFECDDGPLV